MTKLPIESLHAVSTVLKEALGFSPGAVDAYMTNTFYTAPPLPGIEEQKRIHIIEGADQPTDSVQLFVDAPPVLVDLDSWGLVGTERIKVYALFTNDGEHERVSLLLVEKDGSDEFAAPKYPGVVFGQSDHVPVAEALGQTSLSRDTLIDFGDKHKLNATNLFPSVYAAHQLLMREVGS